jgi:hypothetical protein
MRSLMAIRANATSIGVRVTRSFVRYGMTRTRRFCGLQPRSANNRSRNPHRAGWKAKAKVSSAHSNSYFETTSIRIFPRVHAILHLTVARAGTITPRPRKDGHDGENCCRYCENIVNITRREINSALNASRKVLSNKELVPPAKWPLSCDTKTTCPSSLVQVSLVPKFRL